MNPIEIGTFIVDHIAVILGVAAVGIPLIGGVVRWHYKNRIEELQSRVKRLEAPPPQAQAFGLLGTATAPKPAPQDPEPPSLLCWPKTNDASRDDLLDRLGSATERITVFGLTRNFYASDTLRDLIVTKSYSIPVVLFMMDPGCESRVDRYRIEPIEASFEDPDRYRREIERPFGLLAKRTTRIPAGSRQPGLGLYYYNFPCSFAIEEIDDAYRVMLYGHGVRGTESPTLCIPGEHELAAFFSSQLRWLERLATQDEYAPWDAKGIAVAPIEFPVEPAAPGT